jgi:hypothetical protein
MDDLLREVEILERCVAQCTLIAQLAIEPDTRAENGKLAKEYRAIVDRLTDGEFLPDT